MLLLTPDHRNSLYQELLRACKNKNLYTITIEANDLEHLPDTVEQYICSHLEESAGLIIIDGYASRSLQLAKQLQERIDFVMLYNSRASGTVNELLSKDPDSLSFDIPIALINSRWNKAIEIEDSKKLAKELADRHTSRRNWGMLKNLELFWHNYDNFNQQMITEFEQFMGNYYFLPVSLNIQEFRTLFLFVSFFSLYYLCGIESDKANDSLKKLNRVEK